MSGGVPILASCPNCGAIFPSAFGSMFGSGTARRVGFEGNTETCRFCGGEARTADGVFDITRNVITAVSAPHITLVMLAAFEAAVRRAYKEKKAPEELAKDVEKIDPTFGAVVRETGSRSNGHFYRYALLAILATIASCNVKLDARLDLNQLMDQLRNTPPAVMISAPEPPSMEPRPDQPPP